MTSPTIQEHLIAGAIAGLVSTALLHPLDLIKVRYQVNESINSPYKSIFSAIRDISTKEGVRGLYQGLGPAIIASSMSWGGYFFFYEFLKKHILAHRYSQGNNLLESNKLHSSDHLLAGVGAGSVMVFLTNPIWLAKTRLQLQGTYSHKVDGAVTVKKYTGLLDVLVSVYRHEGLPGLYKGLTPALILTSNGAIQFALYEYFKTVSEALRGSPLSGERYAQSAVESMVLGSSSKMLATIVTYPYQVVKSRLQQLVRVNAAGEVVTVATYTGTANCVLEMYRTEGLKSFFKGLLPHCLRVAPSAGLTFVVYEEVLNRIMARSK